MFLLLGSGVVPVLGLCVVYCFCTMGYTSLIFIRCGIPVVYKPREMGGIGCVISQPTCASTMAHCAALL